MKPGFFIDAALFQANSVGSCSGSGSNRCDNSIDSSSCSGSGCCFVLGRGLLSKNNKNKNMKSIEQLVTQELKWESALGAGLSLR